MKKIIVRREVKGDFNQLANLHPVLQRIFAAREVSSPDELSRGLKNLLSFKQMLHVDKAVARLSEALAKQERILIVGDFDADGATSTAVALTALKKFGAKHVNYLVPNRFTYGYGLTPEIVEVALEQKPDVIITVDNGIASHAGVERANESGIDVIVTDHHLPGEVLPAAYAIVNPNQPGDDFPSKCLAGVGVIFYVMLALRSHLNDNNWFETQNIKCPNMAKFLDLVALGTVADVVPLDKNNRILVHQGLERIRAGKARPGIIALLEVAKRIPAQLVASDLGYAIGPRLNAAGRLDDMSLGIECLLAKTPAAAKSMAEQLDQLNYERRAIENQMQREAFEIVVHLNFSNTLPVALCLYDEHWHQGVVGLVASRVKEKIHRPVIAFAKVDDNTLKGSARSIGGLHIRDALDAVATQYPELLEKFGGHAMAAGLSIHPDNFDAFQQAFATIVSQRVNEDHLQGKVETDGPLKHEDITFSLAEVIREAGPWGQGFPEPMFDGEFHLIDQHIVGGRHMKMVLQVPQTDHFIDAIAFNVDTEKWPDQHCKTAQLTYRLNINEYKGRKKLQLLVEEFID